MRLPHLAYAALRKLPFKEAWVPLKMLKGAWQNRNVTLPPIVPAQCGKGMIEIVDGVPIMRLRGDPYQIGFQHGHMLAPQIQLLLRHYLHIFAGQLDYERQLARRMLPFIPPRYREEMRGLCEGAGLSEDEGLLNVCFLDMHKVAACSTFVVHDASSNTGEIVLGRNLDFPALGIAHSMSLVAVIEGDGVRPFASVSWPGFLGCLSGMNTSGLTQAMMLVYGHTRSDHLDAMPFALAYRRVLEECDTVVQAQKLLEQREYGVCNNMMLADKGRDCAVLELHSRSVGVIRDHSDFPTLRCTNHFRTGHRKWTLALTAASSYPRLWRLARAARRRQPFSPDAIKGLLQDVAIPIINLQRMLFYPERLELEVAFGVPSTGQRRYTRFDRAQLWRGIDQQGLPKEHPHP